MAEKEMVLRLTAIERKAVCDVLAMPSRFIDRIRDTAANDDVSFALWELNELEEYVVREANRCRNRNQQEVLDDVCWKIQELRERCADDESREDFGPTAQPVESEEPEPTPTVGASMGRKIKAQDATTGRIIDVDIDQIRSGPIRHQCLPDDLLARVRSIHSRIRDIYDVTLEQFEITFMRDSDPVGEVTVWENITAAFEKVIAVLPTMDKKIVLRTLLGYSMNALTAKEVVDPVARRIIEIAEGK